ncbi:MAG: tyrosine-type recombinase/integrase [Christensenellaceae bacterium]|jgi:site-specific recombinase XerD|nr:tyrosine-type recombinase/integrase [Christensenellaceae bacterium]
MNKDYCFSSPFSHAMEQFINLKIATGQDCRWLKKCFKELDCFAIAEKLSQPEMTPDFVGKWRKSLVNNAPSTIYQKLTVWSMFARYMNRNGYNTFVPQLPKKEPKSFVPYIFTIEQINKIFYECDTWNLKAHHVHSILFAMPTLLRVLYSTGLRISEALSIRNKDINKNERYIHVRKTKNGSERLVPISESLIFTLNQYEYYKAKLPIHRISLPESLYFIKADGSSVSDRSVYNRFRELLKKCNIPHQGTSYGPRVHDLRHTFAVHSLVQLSKNGIDLYTGMPILSACLGHKCLSSTELYVRLTSSMFPELQEKCSPINAFVYPNIYHHE